MIVLDVETFKYDLLTGIYHPDTDTFEFHWNKDAYAPLLKLHEDRTPVVNYNGEHYDLPLLWNWYFNKRNKVDFFQLSKYIVEKHLNLVYPQGFWNSIDLLFNIQNKMSLKLIEGIMGWEIRETTIDFNYEYKLTEAQRREVEFYNEQDLRASWALYKKMKYHFECRIGMCNYLGIEHNYSIPLPTLVGMGLGAHRNDDKKPFDIHQKCKDINIIHKVKDVMLQQMLKPEPGFSYDFEMGGLEYTVAHGGIHSKLKAWSGTDVYHVDVKGYYSLLMMNFNLFSRNLTEEGIQIYKDMYYDRLKFKGDSPITKEDLDRFLKIFTMDLSDPKNQRLIADSMKIGLLAIWGATRNYHHILFDGYVGSLITLYGQLFLLYLIELFAQNDIFIINANTDGLIVKGDIRRIKQLTKIWEQYGDFEVETVHYKRFIQKDVNNYILGNSLESLKVKGRDFTAIKPDWIFSNIILVPQTPVISKLLADILFNEPDNPEQYVIDHIRDYTARDYMYIIHHTMKFDGMRYVETKEPIQRVNRVYAHKEGYMIEKYKYDNSYKYPGLPSCRICNVEMSQVNKDDLDIDYDWYVSEIMRKYVAYYG